MRHTLQTLPCPAARPRADWEILMMRRVAVACESSAVRWAVRRLVENAPGFRIEGEPLFSATAGGEPTCDRRERAPAAMCRMTARSLETLRGVVAAGTATQIVIVLIAPCEECDPMPGSIGHPDPEVASRAVAVARATTVWPSRDVLRPDRPGSEAHPLTLREVEVLRLIAEGLSSREIAARLGISTRTADAHRSHVKRKLRVHSIGDLVRAGIRGGFVAP